MPQLTSPGYAATAALEDFMVGQEARKRQALLDQLKLRDEARQDQELQLRQQQMTQTEQLRQDALREKQDEIRARADQRDLDNWNKVIDEMTDVDIATPELLAAKKRHPELAARLRPESQPPTPVEQLKVGETRSGTSEAQLDQPPPVWRRQPTAEERKAAALRDRLKPIIDTLNTAPPGSPESRQAALQYEVATGRSLPASVFGTPARSIRETRGGLVTIDEATGQARPITMEGTGKPVLGVPAGEAAPHYSVVPEVDPATQRQTGKFWGYNSRTNRFELVPGPTPAGTRPAPNAAKQLETLRETQKATQAMLKAKRLINSQITGPGAGGKENFLMWLGGQSPEANALKTALTVGKQALERAISGGSRAASSPGLVGQWKDILDLKVNAPALLSAIDTSLELLAEPDPSDAPTGDFTAADVLQAIRAKRQANTPNPPSSAK